MKVKLIILLLFLPLFAVAQGICVEWLPVYLCPEECFDVTVCYDTLGSEFFYDSVYIYSAKADSNPGMTGGVWFDPAVEIPQICNASFIGPAGRVFGWDSLYIRADSSGMLAVDTVLWVYHYPPDSGWTPSGLNICPEDSSQLFARWLNVQTAKIWGFQFDSIWAVNSSSHRDAIESRVCVTPDHQAYWSPDSFTTPSGEEIDTLYDPCPTAICTTFTLLPDDVIDDGFYELCPGVCETLIIATYYEYPHCYVYDTLTWCFWDSLLPPDTTLADTIVFCTADCGTSWVYYEETAVCGGGYIDSFAVVVNCLDYEIWVDGAVYDTSSRYCAGETLLICLAGDLCPTLLDDDICWDLGDTTICSLCVEIQVDSTQWIGLTIDDCWGCEIVDSILLELQPTLEASLIVDGGCAGDSVYFTVEVAGSVALDSIFVEYGDGDFEGFAPDSAPFEFSHIYPASGDYILFITYISEFGCAQTESLMLSQWDVTAALSVSPNPVCAGGELTLDASASTVDPVTTLEYKFLAPDSSVLCTLSTSSICIDTVYLPGLYSVVVTAGTCADTATIWVDVIYTEIDSIPPVCAIEGCPRCIELTAFAYFCTTGVMFGYSEVFADSVGTMTILADSLLCVPPVLDSIIYRAYSWCSGCSDGIDSVDVVFAPVAITAAVHDTTLCYGEFIPNLLDTDSVTIEPAGCDVVVQVLFVYSDTLDTTEVLLADWTDPFALPGVFPYEAYEVGEIVYRFSLSDDTTCVQEFVADLLLLHPVAVLDIFPNEVCDFGVDSILFDGSGSFYNCTGYEMAFAYYEADTDSVLTELYPVAGCCEVGADSVLWPMEFPPGDNLFAMVVCMADSITLDILSCCDTAYASLTVFESYVPTISFDPFCAPGTLLANRPITATIDDTSYFEAIYWGEMCPVGTDTLGSGPELVFTIPDTLDFYYLCVEAVGIGEVCTVCVCETLSVIRPITALDCGPATAIEDSIFEFDLTGCIDNPGGYNYTLELIDPPTPDIYLSDSLFIWDTPDNCYVGTDTILIAATSESPCAEACTVGLVIDVTNTFAGVFGIDSTYGTACLDSLNFERLDSTLAEFTLWGTEGFCTNISLQLLGDDTTCNCGFRTNDALEWVNVDSIEGSIVADHFNTPRGQYFIDIYYSDCFAEDTIVTEINVPNHAPEFVGAVREVFIPNDLDTAVTSIDDFFDIDGDPIDFDTFSITRAANYSRLEEAAGLIILKAVEDYVNYPDAPDTLRMTVSDTSGRQVQAAILVWVYDPDKIDIEAGKPERTELVGIYPNPFNSTAQVEARFAESGQAVVDVYDISGKLVTGLFRGYVAAGNYRFVWDGRDNRGVEAASGVYFIRLSLDDRTFVGSVTLLR